MLFACTFCTTACPARRKLLAEEREQSFAFCAGFDCFGNKTVATCVFVTFGLRIYAVVHAHRLAKLRCQPVCAAPEIGKPSACQNNGRRARNFLVAVTETFDNVLRNLLYARLDYFVCLMCVHRFAVYRVDVAVFDVQIEVDFFQNLHCKGEVATEYLHKIAAEIRAAECETAFKQQCVAAAQRNRRCKVSYVNYDTVVGTTHLLRHVLCLRVASVEIGNVGNADVA